MNVSVICAVYNRSPELEETIESFIAQDYEQKRLIIIDGGSDDGVDRVIANYQEHISYFVSEADRGISDAFNKGLQQCEPGYVYFLGAGDRFQGRFSIREAIKYCDYRQDLLVCGRVYCTNEHTGEVTLVAPESMEFQKRSLLFRMSLPHQGLFTSTEYFDTYGSFRLDCKFAMDYELLLRAYHEFPSVIMRDVVVASWVSGGVGSDRTYDVLREYHRIRRINRVANSLTLKLIHIIAMAKYTLKKCFYG